MTTNISDARVFRLATEHTVQEGLRMMKGSSHEEGARNYAWFLRRIKQDLATANLDNINNLHQFHTDFLEGVVEEGKKQGKQHGGSDAANFMAGFFDGICMTIGESRKEVTAEFMLDSVLFAIGVLQDQDDVSPAVSTALHAFAGVLKEHREQINDDDLDGCRAHLFHLLTHFFKRTNNDMLTTEVRLRALISGIFTAGVLTDPASAFHYGGKWYGRLGNFTEQNVQHPNFHIIEMLCGYALRCEVLERDNTEILTFLRKHAFNQPSLKALPRHVEEWVPESVDAKAARSHAMGLLDGTKFQHASEFLPDYAAEGARTNIEFEAGKENDFIDAMFDSMPDDIYDAFTSGTDDLTAAFRAGTYQGFIKKTLNQV